MTAAIREAIRGQALAMGFDAVGFAEAQLAAEARAGLAEYIDRGYHGDMGWLAHTAARRGDPQVLWPEARTVIVLGLNYGGADDPLAGAADPERGAPDPERGAISHHAPRQGAHCKGKPRT